MLLITVIKAFQQPIYAKCEVMRRNNVESFLEIDQYDTVNNV